MEKKAIRQLQIEKLVALSKQPTKKNTASAKLYDQLVATNAWRQATVVALTVSQSIELDTKPLIALAQGAGKQVVIPKTLPQRQMAFFPYDVTKLQKTSFGLLEPLGEEPAIEEIDLIIVPGLAFAADGARLGFGGGYYDRYLAKNQRSQRIALALPEQYFAKPSWLVDEFDIRLNQVIY